MEGARCVVVTLIFILSLISNCFCRPIIRIEPEHYSSAATDLISDGRIDDSLYCDSWRLSVETNNAGKWSQVPEKCEQYVAGYMTGERYLSDSEVVGNDSLTFAKTVKIVGDGKDAWVFDVDETLLSNLRYYKDHGFGSEIFDESSFNKWVDARTAKALPASLDLYEQLQKLGFTIFLLTGRVEEQRAVTEENLQQAGYGNWKRLILRGTSDLGKLATVYKSEKRKGLEDEGYRIRGSSGDQWSDLLGFAIAERSFKLPNPMYYIP